MNYKENKTQEGRILEVLEQANGDWVNGRFFLREMFLSQYHARIWGLQEKGYNIEASFDKDSRGFKSYRLVPKTTLF